MILMQPFLYVRIRRKSEINRLNQQKLLDCISVISITFTQYVLRLIGYVLLYEYIFSANSGNIGNLYTQYNSYFLDTTSVSVSPANGTNFESIALKKIKPSNLPRLLCATIYESFM